VCGGRRYYDRRRVFDTLDEIDGPQFAITCVIHGSATGADLLADEWATERKIEREAYPARWQERGRSAGPERNARMLSEGRPELVVAFPGGRGTADMVRRARAAGVRVLTVD